MQVEFFGIPRERAGMSGVEIHADTLGQLLSTLRTRIPSLSGFIGIEGRDVRLNPVFVASLNGDRFVTDPQTPLAADDHLLILSADAGG